MILEYEYSTVCAIVTKANGFDEEILKVSRIDIENGALLIESSGSLVCYAPGTWSMFVVDDSE